MLRIIVWALLFGATVLIHPGAARAEDPPIWELALTDQLLREHQCILRFFTDLRVFQEDGHDAIEARVHCDDDRAFDVRTLDSDMEFEIKECGVMQC